MIDNKDYRLIEIIRYNTLEFDIKILPLWEISDILIFEKFLLRFYEQSLAS